MSSNLSFSDFLDESFQASVIRSAEKLDRHKHSIADQWKTEYKDWCLKKQLDPQQIIEAMNLDRLFSFLKIGDFQKYMIEFGDAGVTIAESGFPFEAAVMSLQLFKEQSVPYLLSEFPDPDGFQEAFIALDRLYQHSASVLATAYFRIFKRQIARHDLALEQSQKKLELLHNETKHLTITDSLTDLYNQHHFISLLNHEFARATRYGYDFCFLMIDVDSLKNINETMGYESGDNVLRAIADILRTTFRKTDILGRFSGGLFAAMLFESNIEQSSQAAERLRTMVQIQTDKMIGLESKADITVSIGIANFFDSDSPDNLIHLAEEAMARAKQDGHNRIRY